MIISDEHRETVTGHAVKRYKLTPQVAKLLRALMDGVPRAYLAREMDLSENTVKTYCKAIVRSMRVSTVAEAVWLLRGWPLTP